MAVIVSTKVQVFDNDRSDYKIGQIETVEVNSVLRRRDLCEIVINGKKYYFRRSDLDQAIKNAGGTNDTV